MAFRPSFTHRWLLASLLPLSLTLTAFTATATELPAAVTQYIKTQDPTATIRFDGVITLGNGEVYLPVFPQDPTLPKSPLKDPVETLAKRPDLVTFDNGFFLIRLVHTSSGKLALAKVDPYPIRLKEGLLPQDLILPDALYIPNELKIILGDLPYHTDVSSTTSKPTPATTSPTPKAPVKTTPAPKSSLVTPLITPQKKDVINQPTALNPVLQAKPKATALTTPAPINTVAQTAPQPTVPKLAMAIPAVAPVQPKPTVIEKPAIEAFQVPINTSQPKPSINTTEAINTLYVADKTHYQLGQYKLVTKEGQPTLESIDSISLGCLPLTVIQDNSSQLWVPCVNRPEILSIDPQTNGITSRIRLDFPIREVLLIPEANQLIISHRGQQATASSLSAIDLKTRQLINNIPLQNLGGTMAWDALQQTLWVANPTQATVYGVSLATGPSESTTTKSFKALPNISAMVIENVIDGEKKSPSQRLWIASRTLHQVAAINLASGTLETPINVGQKPLALFLNSSGANSLGLSPSSLAKTYDDENTLNNITQKSTPLWVLSAGDDRLQAIETTTGNVTTITTLPAGIFPTTMTPHLTAIRGGAIPSSQPISVTLIPAGQDGILWVDPTTGAITYPTGLNARIGGIVWAESDSVKAALPTSKGTARLHGY